MIKDKNHKPKNGWTLMILDLDELPDGVWKDLPWAFVSKLDCYKDAPNEEKQEFLDEILEFSKD